MSQSPRRIVAIGGGGFLMDDDSLVQERWLLTLARSRRPSVVYVGTASGDAERGQLKFLRAFSQLECRPSCLSFFPYDLQRDYRQAVLDADVVYVGGGNTVAMLAVWREFGFDAALNEAYRRGTVLAGMSAGANCWFERYVTDSVPGGGVRSGLGWLPGSFCPHLDGEPWREAVLGAQPAPAAGAGNGVAVLFENEVWRDAVHNARGTARLLRRVDREPGFTAVEPRRLGAAMPTLPAP